MVQLADLRLSVDRALEVGLLYGTLHRVSFKTPLLPNKHLGSSQLLEGVGGFSSNIVHHNVSQTR